MKLATPSDMPIMPNITLSASITSSCKLTIKYHTKEAKFLDICRNS
jgi:hypothetical protein